MGANSVPTPEITGKHGKRVTATVVRSAIGVLLALAAIALVAGCAADRNQASFPSHSFNPISQSAFALPSPTPSNAAQTAPAPLKESV